jgi:MFS family permease
LLKTLKLEGKPFYGWVIVAVFFIICVILVGSSLSFGVFFKSIESEFEISRATTSGILSVYMVLGAAFSILGGWALDRYGPRIIILLMGLFTGLSFLLSSQTTSLWQLYITYALFLSVGVSAIYVVRISTISRWFKEKRGLALGIASSGIGLGQVIMVPLATFLISTLAWRIAYIVMGLIAWLIVLPLSRLLKRDPYEMGTFPDGRGGYPSDTENVNASVQLRSLSLIQALKTRSFWALILMTFSHGFSFMLIQTHIIPYTTDIGFTIGEAATVLSLLGGVSIIGGIIMGRVSDSFGRKTTIITSLLLQAGACVWLIWTQDSWIFFPFAIIYGFASGGFTPPLNVITSDTFGLHNIGLITGTLSIGWGIGAAVGPIIGGVIFDVKQSYSIAFLLVTGIMLTAALLTTLIKREIANTR